jgi:glycerol-3-phosphate dehydrogenase (NAD(P)+)
LIAEGLTPELAKKKIGMVVEGAYTCTSALQLGTRAHIPIPITEAVYAIIYENQILKKLLNLYSKERLKKSIYEKGCFSS